MAKTILFVSVEDDGVGDFSHLADIYAYMRRTPSLHDHEVVPIVGYGFKHSVKEVEKFRAALKAINDKDYFLYPAFSPDSGSASRPYVGYGIFYGTGCVSYRIGSTPEFTSNVLIQQHLSEATQIIIISSSSLIPLPAMRQYARPEVIFKFIAEHEKEYSFPDVLHYPLGLGDEAYGIKIKTLQKISLAAACEIFALQDPEFNQALLDAADCKNVKDYCLNNMLIPAYFSEFQPALQFITLLARNQKLASTTNLHIYLSGKSAQVLQEIFSQASSIKKLKNTNLKQIVLLAKGKEQDIFTLNPEGTRSVTIFVGFNLNDASYFAINQQAVISGVSGDNSFELAAGLSLPYYHSTNFCNKRASLQTLEKICDDLSTLPEQIKADFKTFFSSLEVWNEERDMLGNKQISEVAEQFKVLDLPGMFEHWHLFAAYLQQHYNFYDKLADIILTNTVKNNKEHFADLPERRGSNLKKTKLLY
jgi:hypothetical protein